MVCEHPGRAGKDRLGSETRLRASPAVTVVFLAKFCDMNNLHPKQLFKLLCLLNGLQPQGIIQTIMFVDSGVWQFRLSSFSA